MPIKGDTAVIIENTQIICTYRDAKNLSCVTKCHERSLRTTELYRIKAIEVRVYNELIP